LLEHLQTKDRLAIYKHRFNSLSCLWSYVKQIMQKLQLLPTTFFQILQCYLLFCSVLSVLAQLYQYV